MTESLWNRIIRVLDALFESRGYPGGFSAILGYLRSKFHA